MDGKKAGFAIPYQVLVSRTRGEGSLQTEVSSQPKTNDEVLESGRKDRD